MNAGFGRFNAGFRRFNAGFGRMLQSSAMQDSGSDTGWEDCFADANLMTLLD